MIDIKILTKHMKNLNVLVLVQCDNWSNLLNDELTCIRESLIKNEWLSTETLLNSTGLSQIFLFINSKKR